MEYKYKDKTLLKDKDDDLYVIDENGNKIWELSSLTKAKDWVTSILIEEERYVTFLTFNGMKYKLDLENLSIINKQIVK